MRAAASSSSRRTSAEVERGAAIEPFEVLARPLPQLGDEADQPRLDAEFGQRLVGRELGRDAAKHVDRLPGEACREQEVVGEGRERVADRLEARGPRDRRTALRWRRRGRRRRGTQRAKAVSRSNEGEGVEVAVDGGPRPDPVDGDVGAEDLEDDAMVADAKPVEVVSALELAHVEVLRLELPVDPGGQEQRPLDDRAVVSRLDRAVPLPALGQKDAPGTLRGLHGVTGARRHGIPVQAAWKTLLPLRSWAPAPSLAGWATRKKHDPHAVCSRLTWPAPSSGPPCTRRLPRRRAAGSCCRRGRGTPWCLRR